METIAGSLDDREAFVAGCGVEIEIILYGSTPMTTSMKKRPAVLLLLATFSIFGSCRTQAVRYDGPRGDAEGEARVLVDKGLEIVSINGEAYRSYAGQHGDQRAFLFADGDYVFLLRYVSKDRIFKTLTDRVFLDCTFTRGKYYEIYAYFTSAEEISIGYQEIQPREKELRLFSD